MTKEIPIGFSTGCFWQYFDPLSTEIVEFIANTGATAIELAAMKEERIKKLSSIPPQYFESFSYVSIHAPPAHSLTQEMARKLEEACKILPIDAVTIHCEQGPEWDSLEQYDIPFAIENMDERKLFGKEPQNFIDCPYPLVFDVNHILTNDPTLQLGHEFLEAYSDKIIHVHFSGAKIKRGFLNHHPISETKQNELFDITPQKPIIIECEFDTGLDIKKAAEQEINYIREKLH